MPKIETKQSTVDQFDKKLEEYLNQSSDYCMYNRLNEHDASPLIIKWFQSNDMSFKFGSRYCHWIAASQKCDSPIEEMLLLALGTKAYEQSVDNVFFKKTELQACEDLIIEQQVKKLDYIIDFKITLNRLYKYEPWSWQENIIYVECDGHDFHEKTKEQTSRDRKRDRDLMFDGDNLVRFTGSEIWKNPFQCAEEIFKLLESKSTFKNIVFL